MTEVPVGSCSLMLSLGCVHSTTEKKVSLPIYSGVFEQNNYASVSEEIVLNFHIFIELSSKVFFLISLFRMVICSRITFFVHSDITRKHVAEIT